MNDFVLVGQIVALHGLDGKVKVISDTNLKEKIFVVGQNLYVGENYQALKINSYQTSGKYDLLSFMDFLASDLVAAFIGQNLYVKLSELHLAKDEYLTGELMGAKIYENNKDLGCVKEILKGKAYNYLKCKNRKEYLIPLIKEYIVEFNREKKIIITQGVEQLMDLK